MAFDRNTNTGVGTSEAKVRAFVPAGSVSTVHIYVETGQVPKSLDGEAKEASMTRLGRSLMHRCFNDSFTLDNGVSPCVVEISVSKRSSNESHPHPAPSQIVNPLRGGKTRGKEQAG